MQSICGSDSWVNQLEAPVGSPYEIGSWVISRTGMSKRGFVSSDVPQRGLTGALDVPYRSDRCLRGAMEVP